MAAGQGWFVPAKLVSNLNGLSVNFIRSCNLNPGGVSAPLFEHRHKLTNTAVRAGSWRPLIGVGWRSELTGSGKVGYWFGSFRPRPFGLVSASDLCISTLHRPKDTAAQQLLTSSVAAASTKAVPASQAEPRQAECLVW